MLRLRAVVAATLLLQAAAISADATTYNFSATVTSANIGNLTPGDVVEGTLVFDPATSGSTQLDGTRSYFGAITNFQLAGLQIIGPPNQNVIDILSFSASGFNDMFDARLGSAVSTLEFYLESDGNTGTLGNGSLPSTALSLAAFQNPSSFHSTYVQFSDYTNGYRHLDADLTAITSVAVPEPASLALLVLSFSGLSALVRHIRRSSLNS